MHYISAFSFANLLVCIFSHDVNYCGAKMCGYSDAHTFCQYTSGPSAECAGYINAALSGDEKSRILARLNRKRDDAAAGRVRGLPSAGNMLKLRWVNELAREAQLWADRCRPPKSPEEHDPCRDLYSVTVGQCVASVVGEAPGLRVESMVDIWFMQNILYKGNVTLYEPPEPGKRFYGDFAQMMWARTYMVGCGRSRFMVPLRGRLRTVERLVCNFAPQGPTPYRPLWTPGVPATACPPRSRPYAVLSSLCNYQNELNQASDIDESMTMEEHILLNTVLELEINETQNENSLDMTYLTYLAIVTMEESEITSTRYINSMQKRDIIEHIDKEDMNGGMLGDLEPNLHSTINQTTKSTVMKPSKKKPKLFIGRPKSYNVEDLSEQKAENHETTESISKRKKAFYDEYNIDATEENEMTTLEHETEKNFNEKDTSERRSADIIPTNVTSADFLDQTETIAFLEQTYLLDEITVTKADIQSNNTYYNKSTPFYNETLTVTYNTMEDYLSDPETVRELQEALDRMEHDASTVNISKSSGKVRRELRSDSPSNQVVQNGLTLLPNGLNEVKDSDLTLLPNGLIMSPEIVVTSTLLPMSNNLQEEQNTTLDRGHMLNMVMKYMPYLKPYENEFLGTNNSVKCAFSLDMFMLTVLLSAFLL